jgi:hypothetical protein
MGIPLEIMHSIIEEPCCNIGEIEKKIESLTRDVMNMIYIVATRKNSSFHDLQGEEEELGRIREKTVKDVSEKVRKYILNNLLHDVSIVQGSFTIALPSMIYKYLSSITDNYLAILIGACSNTLVKDCDEIILNLFKHVMSQLYVVSEEDADSFGRVVSYIVRNITNIKHLYNIRPKYLLNLFRQIEKSGGKLIYRDYGDHSYYVVKLEPKEPIIRGLKEDSPIKYYSSLNRCKFCNRVYLSNKNSCDDCHHKLEEIGDGFLIPCSLLDDVGKVFEALVYLGLRSNTMDGVSLTTHNIMIDDREYDILRLQLTYVDNNRESLDIRVEAIDVIECKLKAEDRDVIELIEKLNSKTMKKLEEVGVEINPYIICIESESTRKDNINIVTLNDWKDLSNILFN